MGVVVAVAAAVMMSRGASQTIGLASSVVQVTTPQSSSVEASSNSDQLPNHAPLLADLLATQSSREQIARAAGVPADQLSVVDQRLAAPVVATPLPTAASQDATGMGASYTLVLDPYTSLPIVKIGAIAPNEPAASRLVGAATEVLKAIAAQGRSRASPGLQVSVISTPKLRQIVHRPRKMRAAAVAFVVLILWCTAVILISSDGAAGHSDAVGAVGSFGSAPALSSLPSRRSSA